MPDLRYHLISLISVFLALAIGVLLGVAVADRGVVSDRVRAEITSIERDVDRQQTEIYAQREEAADQQRLLDDMSDSIIAGSLDGVDAALVLGPYANGAVGDALEEALTSAGADLYNEQLPRPVADGPAPQQPTTLNAASASASAAQERTELGAGYAAVSRQVLDPTGEPEDSPEVIIFLGGGRIPDDAPPNTPDALAGVQGRMLAAWDERARVIGAEPSSAGRSEVPLFEEAGIPSVDNADQEAGRAAVVRLATTDDDGSYGLKNTADEEFPPPED